MNGKDAVKNIIYGVAIGDAAGCPVQFFERGDVKKLLLNITDMVGRTAHTTNRQARGRMTQA